MIINLFRDYECTVLLLKKLPPSQEKDLISNGFAEGLNHALQFLKRKVYGFCNFSN
ncbi:MAG: transposase [Acidobacteriota bacterium]